MKAVELRCKTESELKDMLVGLKRELMNLRFQRINGELANTSRFSLARREVARIKTVLREKRA
ncbi:MAG: 50S ribosomal protein L29 [Holosporales bacterium]